MEKRLLALSRPVFSRIARWKERKEGDWVKNTENAPDTISSILYLVFSPVRLSSKELLAIRSSWISSGAENSIRIKAYSNFKLFATAFVTSYFFRHNRNC